MAVSARRRSCLASTWVSSGSGGLRYSTWNRCMRNQSRRHRAAQVSGASHVLACMRLRNGLLAATLLVLAAASPAAASCDPIDPSACMLPFPDDFFTKADSSTPTGRRVNFDIASMPRNVAGKPIDPTDWNRADGFSPGSEIVTYVPGLDL